jgi:hypothetical protein
MKGARLLFGYCKYDGYVKIMDFWLLCFYRCVEYGRRL